jgi:hypothetical protein
MSRSSLSVTFIATLFIASSILTIVEPADSADYFKCSDRVGKIYISNVGCPNESGKVEKDHLRDMSALEYQEAQRKEKEKAERDQKYKRAIQKIEDDGQRDIWELQNLSPRQRKEMQELRYKQELLDAIRKK